MRGHAPSPTDFLSGTLPEHARAVVIGGGIVGASVAYHLVKLGWRDVVLLEQNRVGGGSTFHAAGMVGRIRASNAMTQIAEYSARLYAALERETGVSTGWKQVGSLILARTAERTRQLRRSAALAEHFGVETQLIAAAAAKERWPLMQVDDVQAALWVPHDGKVVPRDTAVALAKGAMLFGAQVFEGVRVLEVEQQHGRITGVRTQRGTIRADRVVIAGGMWSRELGLRCGVTLPLWPVEHHYLVSEPVPGCHDELPCARDPDGLVYFRGEEDRVVLGAFQPHSKAWEVDRVPEGFSFQLLPEDWPAYQAPLAEGRHRIPALAQRGFARFVNGPEAFTPDNNFILGEAPALDGLYVAAGFNSLGIASGGGAGRLLAEWMIAGEPPIDLWSVDVRRFMPAHNNRFFLKERVTEMLGLHYAMAWPNRELETGRGLRKSPLHDRLAQAGACFGQKAGFERPLWFARDGLAPIMEYGFDRQSWFPCHAAEHRAAREAVAIFDQTSFAKLAFKGRDVAAIMQRLCGNDVDVPAGRAVYTGMFNARGTYESDLTLVRLSSDEYYVITSTAQLLRDYVWIERHIAPHEQAELSDVSNAFAVIGVMGPRSRELLLRLTDADLSTAAFPFGSARRIAVGTSTVLAVRLSYVGELGYELHVPTDQATQVLDALLHAGADLGATLAGHYAQNSLRLEKGYRAWGAELSTDDTPLEAGLAFAVAWDKSLPFLGRDALVRQREAGVDRRLGIFVLEDPAPVLWGGERIFRGGRAVGYTTSGSYGHTLGAAVGMGYVRGDGVIGPEILEAPGYEIEIDGRRWPAKGHARAPYDPARARVLM